MAKPSAIAVLPTPGSPTKIGLFFERRVRICSVLRISSSRPITGSSFPLRAISFKFFPYFCNELYCCDCVCELTVDPFLNSLMADTKPFSVKPPSFNNLPASSFTCNKPNIKCSVLTNSSPNCFNAAFAFNNALFISRLMA